MAPGFPQLSLGKNTLMTTFIQKYCDESTVKIQKFKKPAEVGIILFSLPLFKIRSKTTALMPNSVSQKPKNLWDQVIWASNLRYFGILLK